MEGSCKGQSKPATFNVKKLKWRRGISVDPDGVTFTYRPPGLDVVCCLPGKRPWADSSLFPSSPSSSQSQNGSTLMPAGIHYFEVHIDEIALGGVVVVGIVSQKMMRKKKTFAMPGTRIGSYGFHSDGRVVLGGRSRSMLGRVWGRGDTIGFGVDMTATRFCFVTLNGSLVENFSSGVLCKLPERFHVVYPAVGVDCYCKARANFSGPFKYDPATLPFPRHVRTKYVHKLNHKTIEMLNDASNLIAIVDTLDSKQKREVKQLLKSLLVVKGNIPNLHLFVVNKPNDAKNLKEFFGVNSYKTAPLIVFYQLPQGSLRVFKEGVNIDEENLREFIDGGAHTEATPEGDYTLPGVTTIAFSENSWVVLKRDSTVKTNPLFVSAHHHRVILKGRKVKSFPTELWSQLQREGRILHLELSKNDMQTLPTEVSGLTQVVKLALARNQLVSLPTEIYQNLSNLTKLNLRANQISELPPEIGRLKNLTELNLWGNKLPDVPVGLGGLTDLKRLNLRANKMLSLSPEIGDLTALTDLVLWGNKLRKLPPEIGRLQKLRSLDLDRNLLKFVPTDIGNLTDLIHLVLGNNRIPQIPAEIGKLTRLTQLDVSNNKLKTLPAEIGNLTNLTFLHLSHNKLVSVPPEVGRLSNLIHLELSDNKLTELPYDFWDLERLEYAFFKNNRFKLRGKKGLEDLIQRSIEFITFDSLMLLVGAEMRPDFKWMIQPKDVKKHKLIGSGKFGNVYRGEYNGRPCAIKFFIEKDDMNWVKFCQELGVILHLKRKNLHSSFLADIYGAHISPVEPFIVMELGECSLYDLIYSPPEGFQWNLKVKLEVLRSIAVCLDKLAMGDGQGNGVCHGDLHAKNILVMKKDPLTLKIADWGLSKSISTSMVLDTKSSHKQLTTSLYTPAVAPELYEGEWTMSADIFSYAILCYQVLTQEPLFIGMTEPEIRRSIRTGGRPSLAAVADNRLKTLIQRCWAQDSDRPTPAKIVRKIDKLLNVGLFCSVTLAATEARRKLKNGDEGGKAGDVREIVMSCPRDETESAQLVKKLKDIAWGPGSDNDGDGDDSGDSDGGSSRGIMILVDGDDIDETLFEMLHEFVRPQSVVYVLPTVE